MDGGDARVFELDIDYSLCIKGRESEIYSVLSNLVFNAVRYTPPGGRISIRWADTDTGPEFTVEDTGVGIAAQHIARITERFYRVDAGRSREHGSIFCCCFPPELRADCGLG